MSPLPRIRNGLIALFAVAVAAWLVRDAGRAALIDAAYPPPPEGMALIRPGWFLTGSDHPDADPDEGPLRRAFCHGFYMDLHEVTNRDYAAFDPDHAYPVGRDAYPVTGLTRERAKAYAACAGKRLPTALEWERAARGTDGRPFPWGDAFVPGCANIVDGGGLAPVGSYPSGSTVEGVHDLIGNAWEWVDGYYTEPWTFGVATQEKEVIKGGAFSYPVRQARASYNGFEPIGNTCNDIGFRCVKDAAPK